MAAFTQRDLEIFDRLEWELHQVMMALGIIPDFADWYACGDDLI